MTTLKDVALELLKEYEYAETNAIWDSVRNSGDYENRYNALLDKIEKYQILIEKLAPAN